MKKKDRLNIKNAEARLLAGQLAQMRGETITTVVTAALREKLARVRRNRAATALKPAQNRDSAL